MKTIKTFQPFLVTVKDPYLCNAAEREIEYILSLDSDKLLANFRINAGIETDSTPYGGWENSLIGGHTLGHYLSAISLSYASTFGTPDQKDDLLEKLNYIVDELYICQKRSKTKKGFLWGGKKINDNPESQFDCVERGETNIKTEAWVPWYTMHKIIAGLIDCYLYAGNETALEIASGLGDWTYSRVSRLSKIKRHKVLSVEYGGMNDCLYNLYEITRDEHHAIAAHFFDEQILVDKILDGGTDYLNRLHVNTTIAKVIGLANRFRILEGQKIKGKKIGAGDCYEAAKAFWQMVVDHHSYITGGNSEWESFGLDDILDGERTECNCETCNTYNMLKLSQILFSISGEKKYLDYYENTFINAILSSQNPETGMTTYFQPMATGYFKVFADKYTKFWCCTGTGLENFSKLGNNIYYKLGNCLIVSMYFTSSVKWVERGVKLYQEANLEHSDVVKFRLHGNTTLAFRIPDWAGSYSLTVKGRDVDVREECGFLQYAGQDGDEIELKLERTIRAYSLPDDKDVYAFKFGPYVLSADLGNENMKTTTTGVDVTIPAEKIVESEEIELTGDETVAEFMNNISNHFVQYDSNTFELTGINRKLTYKLHFRQYKNRYGIYFYFFKKGEGRKKYSSKYTIIDTIRAGYGQYETDVFHDLREELSVSNTEKGTYRYAKKGGRFCYRMTVDKDKQNFLVIHLLKADNGKTLHITAANRIIFSEKLNYQGNETTYEMILPIPESAVQEIEPVREEGEIRTMIQICFSGIDYAESAKVCEFIYMTIQ